MTSKLDRRKKYTRMVLKDSLIELLKEKQISAITVKEICELADINRSTFYAHYADQYDLLDKIEDEIIEDMTGYLNQYHLVKEEDAFHIIEKLIDYFASKHEVCRTLFSEENDTTFQKKVMRFAQEVFQQHWPGSTLTGNDSKYLSTFVISGSIHVIKSWLNNGMDKSTTDMAEVISQLINKGLYGMKEG
ncbi:TetR/AcrR family transcriptional regulator [Radiobacillus deserti]|uniref:TetR/AcrR family transcriptional regulator n=1 Tax=Radiobacillus deserti TaxID=2594883 RepID=A0A516KDK9_9BACI|nr:TetR-like C-terminal domain-containing protein [Radiobacillus deserti]QDP39495.1 TetR/AcrR family transcriptional regulator [Radiobacillus deserti]